MAKIKVKVKPGSQGKPLGKYIAEYKQGDAEKGKLLYRPKAKLNVHLKKWK